MTTDTCTATHRTQWCGGHTHRCVKPPHDRRHWHECSCCAHWHDLLPDRRKGVLTAIRRLLWH